MGFVSKRDTTQADVIKANAKAQRVKRLIMLSYISGKKKSCTEEAAAAKNSDLKETYK